MASGPSPVEKFGERDPEFHDLVNAVTSKALTGGALDGKTKFLISLAIAAAGNHPEGVTALAAKARSLGATEEEIIETIRLVYFNSGMPALMTALAAFGQ